MRIVQIEMIEKIHTGPWEAFAAPSGDGDQPLELVNPAVDAIVAGAQGGCPAAFEKLYSTYSGRLYRKVLSITRDPQDAEDALQDTFLRDFLALRTLEGKSKVYTWLTRIAVNSALMILRKRRSRVEVLFDPQPDDRYESPTFDVADSAPTPEVLFDLSQRRPRTLRAINRLKPHLRTPLQMQVMRGWSIREISRALNVSEASVKSRLHRARRQLSTSQADYGFVPLHSQLTDNPRMNR
jgi:RNA polymerase sigma-70 factor, ECF subfamily